MDILTTIAEDTYLAIFNSTDMKTLLKENEEINTF